MNDILKWARSQDVNPYTLKSWDTKESILKVEDLQNLIYDEFGGNLMAYEQYYVI